MPAERPGASQPVDCSTGDPAAAQEVPPASPTPTGAGQPSEPLRAYRDAVNAMRDTTKWLLTVVPAVSAVVGLAAVVPEVSSLRADDPDRALALALLLAAGVLSVVAIIAAARVLTVSPAGWGEVVQTMAGDRNAGILDAPGGRKLQAEADRQGVIRLYGFRSTEDLLAALTLDATGVLPVSVAAGEVLSDFATLRVVRGRFRAFLILGGLAAAGAIGCLASAAIVASGSDVPIDAPSAVQLVPNQHGREVLKTVGCVASDGRVEAIAIAGSWREPEVVVDDAGDDCPPVSLAWKREWGAVVPTP